MAYSTSNPPRLLSPAVGKLGSGIWIYQSADAAALVRVAGYFTNGFDLGIRAGDVLIMIDTDDFSANIMVCTASTATSTDFNDGTAIAATDTD